MKPSPALRKELQRLEARSARGFKELRAASKAQAPGRRMVMAEVLPLPAALNDRLLEQHAQEALLAAYGAAHGLSQGALCECFGCRCQWSQRRTPGSFLKITLSRPNAMLLALLCWECCARPLADVQRTVTDGMRRDFLGEGGQVSTLAPAGRA